MPLPLISGPGVGLPVFLRKIRRSDWGAEGDTKGARAENAALRVFLDDVPPYSLYSVSSDEDLRRVLLALNANRTALISEEDRATERLRDSLDYVLFLAEEARQAGVTFATTPGNTPCGYANGLHVDMSATPDRLRRLCELAIEAGRQATRCGRGDMGEVVVAATKEQCRSVRGVASPCLVPECPRIA